MDATDNPYTPGAGLRPTALSGREIPQQQFLTTLRRLGRGQGSRCPLIVGLRGVGKTVLLSRFARIARDEGWIVAEHEVDPGTNLVQTVAALARESLLELDPPSRWDRAAARTATILRGLQVTYAFGGLNVSLGTPDDDEQAGRSGELSRDLTDLLVALGSAAAEHDTGVVFMFDELQFADPEPLGALIAAVHKVAQRDLPLTLVGAGLPQVRGVLAEAKSYAERLFEVIDVGRLVGADARDALEAPARSAGAEIAPEAVDHVLSFTDGYPYFLQAYGDHVWQLSDGPRISLEDAQAAESSVRKALDEGFFRFRTDRLTRPQQRYLRAMAELGGLEASSGDVATTLGMRSSAQAGQVREALIKKGLIYSPRLGHAAFTVPQFGGYMKRHFELEQHAPQR